MQHSTVDTTRRASHQTQPAPIGTVPFLESCITLCFFWLSPRRATCHVRADCDSDIFHLLCKRVPTGPTPAVARGARTTRRQTTTRPIRRHKKTKLVSGRTCGFGVSRMRNGLRLQGWPRHSHHLDEGTPHSCLSPFPLESLMYVEELTIPHTEFFAPCENSIVTQISTCVCRAGQVLQAVCTPSFTAVPVRLHGM